MSPSQHLSAAMRARFDALAATRDSWSAKNAYFHETDQAYLRFLVSEGCRVLVVGCGTGDIVAGFDPAARSGSISARP